MAHNCDILIIKEEQTLIIHDVGVQGIQGPAGPQGPVGSDKNFVFNQAIPSDTWNITHNLGKRPSVVVIDSAGSSVEGLVTYTDDNNIILTFSAEFTGDAIFN